MNSKSVALKKIKFTNEINVDLLNEMQSINLNHPNVIQVYAFDKEDRDLNQNFLIFMEILSYGDMRNFIETNKVKKNKRIMGRNKLFKRK